VNKKRRKDWIPTQDKENYAWLKSDNLSIVSNRSRKYTPPYVGPFRVLSYDKTTSTYKLDLPERYTNRRISTTFHASQIKPYVPNNENLFPNRLTNPVPTFPLEQMILSVDRHFWKNEQLYYICKFDKDGTGTFRADSEEMANPECQRHIDIYLDRKSVKDAAQLPKEVSRGLKLSKSLQGAKRMLDTVVENHTASLSRDANYDELLALQHKSDSRDIREGRNYKRTRHDSRDSSTGVTEDIGRL